MDRGSSVDSVDPMRVLIRTVATSMALALTATGCAASTVSEPGTASPTAMLSADASAVIAEANAMPLVSTLNGEVPPGEPTLVMTSAEVLNLMRDGQQVRVYRDTRDAGTRSPIHVHPFGGWTCVVSGQAVLYVEGEEPKTARTGECVAMPPLRAMSNANPGPGTSVLLDNFVTPSGAPVWRIVEQGETQLGDEFADGHGTQTNAPH